MNLPDIPIRSAKIHRVPARMRACERRIRNSDRGLTSHCKARLVQKHAFLMNPIDATMDSAKDVWVSAGRRPLKCHTENETEYFSVLY